MCLLFCLLSPPPSQGQATDIAIRAQEILSLRERLNHIYVDHTQQPLSVIEESVERDHFMSADQAKDFGIIDEVIQRRPIESAKE